jgi:hypothetical protein
VYASRVALRCPIVLAFQYEKPLSATHLGFVHLQLRLRVLHTHLHRLHQQLAPQRFRQPSVLLAHDDVMHTVFLAATAGQSHVTGGV